MRQQVTEEPIKVKAQGTRRETEKNVATRAASRRLREARERAMDREEVDLMNSPLATGHGQYPLITKGKILAYVPWTFMDAAGLAKRLPNMCEGVQKWITRFEEQTMGHQLAIEDIKAILSNLLGKAKLSEAFFTAGLQGAVDDPRWDSIPIGNHRNNIWDALRQMYPTKAYPGKLEKMKLENDEGPAQFIPRLQNAWQDEMNS